MILFYINDASFYEYVMNFNKNKSFENSTNLTE